VGWVFAAVVVVCVVVWRVGGRGGGGEGGLHARRWRTRVPFPQPLSATPHPGAGRGCHAQESSWSEASFYAWRYERPTSVWTYLGSVLLPVVVILGCLFPLAPWWLRMAFVYLLMGLLTALLGLLAGRYAVYGAVWMLSGHSLWIFPNLVSDEVRAGRTLKRGPAVVGALALSMARARRGGHPRLHVWEGKGGLRGGFGVGWWWGGSAPWTTPIKGRHSLWIFPNLVSDEVRSSEAQGFRV
jgi:hypothetical protein